MGRVIDVPTTDHIIGRLEEFLWTSGFHMPVAETHVIHATMSAREIHVVALLISIRVIVVWQKKISGWTSPKMRIKTHITKGDHFTGSHHF